MEYTQALIKAHLPVHRYVQDLSSLDCALIPFHFREAGEICEVWLIKVNLNSIEYVHTCTHKCTRTMHIPGSVGHRDVTQGTDITGESSLVQIGYNVSLHTPRGADIMVIEYH